jgi:hypothetical protein
VRASKVDHNLRALQINNLAVTSDAACAVRVGKRVTMVWIRAISCPKIFIMSSLQVDYHNLIGGLHQHECLVDYYPVYTP